MGILEIFGKSHYFKKLVFKNFDVIETLAEKEFMDPNDAIQATSYVLDYLEEKSWLKDQFKKDSSFRTFLIAVVKNKLRDYFRMKFGRIRPPKWINDQGGLWIKIFKKLCVQQMSILDVEYSLTHIIDNEKTQREIQIIVDTILAKVKNCRKNKQLWEQTEEEYADSANPDSAFEQEEKIRITLSVYASIIENESRSPGTNKQLYIKYLKFHKILELKTNERLFMKHIYETRLSINKAGEMMGWNSNQSHSKNKQIKERINKALKKSGLGEEIIKLI